MKSAVNHNKAAKKKKQSSISIIECVIVGACFFAVLMFIVSNYVELSTITTQTSRLKAELESLQNDEKGLKAKQEQIFNLTDVENMAKNELGMIKLDKSQICYIEMESPEKIVLASQSEDVPKIVKSAIKNFSIVVEYLN